MIGSTLAAHANKATTGQDCSGGGGACIQQPHDVENFGLSGTSAEQWQKAHRFIELA